MRTESCGGHAQSEGISMAASVRRRGTARDEGRGVQDLQATIPPKQRHRQRVKEIERKRRTESLSLAKTHF